MQFTFHATRRTPHGASRLEQAMSAWLVKTRRAPSRHSRDARVYGHTTTAMHKLSTPLPPPPSLRASPHHFQHSDTKAGPARAPSRGRTETGQNAVCVKRWQLSRPQSRRLSPPSPPLHTLRTSRHEKYTHTQTCSSAFSWLQ